MPKDPLSILPAPTPVPETAELDIVTTMADLNRLIHEPARLAILTVLSSCTTADFTFLQTATGLTKGNLSVQLTRLEEGNLIRSEKTIVRKRTLTTLGLTKTGRAELRNYWSQMERIRNHAAQTVAAKKEEKTASAKTKQSIAARIAYVPGS